MAPSWAPVVLLCTVLSCCHGVEFGWLPHREFSFSVQGKDLAALPQLKSQYAGFSYSGELRVQSHSPRILLFKLFNMNYTSIHEELREGWWDGPDNTSRNKTKPLVITTSTIVVKMKKSTSPEIVMEAGLSDWQINFIKGLISTVLAYLNDNSIIGPNSRSFSNSELQETYSVFEDSVVGRCEVLYEVNPLPYLLGLSNRKLCDNRQMWEITKTYNFSNCQVLSEDHGHLPTKDCTPGGANCGQFWSRASLTQMVGCGELNNFVLLSSISSSTINAHLHLQNDSQAVVNSNLNITLSSLMDLKRKFNTPQNIQSVNSLLYSYSKMPKDLYSRPCQDSTGSNQEKSPNDLEVENNSNMSGEQINREIRNGTERRTRYRRAAMKKYSKTMKAKSYDQSNEDAANSYSSSYRPNYNDNPTDFNNYDPNNFNNDNGKRKRFNNKNSNRFNNDNLNLFNNDNSNQFNSKNKTRKNDFWERSSEEMSNQPSEELQLEEQWNISGKEQTTQPPHQPFNMFSLVHRRTDVFSCLNQKLRQIIADIASDLEDINILPEKQTMDKFSLAIDICKSMPLDHLSLVSEEVFEIHSGHSSMMKSKERSVFRDVVTMCGTHPAFQLIKGWIERQQVEGEEAAQMIASLPSHIHSPSKDLFEDFFVMVQQISEKNEEQLTTTAVLALSNLVRQACVHQRTRQNHFSSILRPACDLNSAKHFTEWLVHQLDSDTNHGRVIVEALGNIGSTEVVGLLGHIAVNPKYSSYTQTSAVFAMRYLALRRNPAIVPLLMSLYHNYTLSVSTRVSAVSVLVYSDPGIAVWQRLAISTWYEPSPAVANFVAFSIHSMATTKDTLYSHLSKSAKLVLPLTKPSRLSPYRPYSILYAWHTSDFEKVVLEQSSWMQFYDYTNLYYRHSSRSCGFSRTNIEASFSAANLDDLWSAFKELMISTNENHRWQRPSNNGIPRSLQQIKDVLNLHPRSMPPLQAEIHLKINSIMERMLVINKNNFKSWAKDGRRIMSEVLTEGKTFSYQKADMDYFQISTTTGLGFPVEFRVRTPWIVQAKADLNITTEGLVMGTAFMYYSQLLSSLGVMSPWDGTAHLAGAYATNFIQLPPFRSIATMKEHKLKLTTTYVDQHRLLYFSMQPFTSQYKINVHQPILLSSDTTKIQLGETVQMPISWLSRYLKTVYSSEETENFNPMDYIYQLRGILSFPLMMPNMEARSFETVMNPMHPVIMNFSMSLASKSDGMLEYESVWDNLIGKLFDDLSKPKAFEEFRFLNPEGNNFKNQKHLHNSSNSNVTDNKNGNKTNKEESDLVINTENRSFEENGLLNSTSMDSKGYKLYSTTYESAHGSFNASEINPFANNVNGSSQSYVLEQALSKINSGTAVVLEFMLQSTNPDQPTNLAAFATYSTTYSMRVHRWGLFLKKDSSQVRMTAVHEDPVDIAVDLSQRVNQDLQHNIFLDYVAKNTGHDTSASIKASLGASRSTLSQLRSTPLLIDCSQLDSQNVDSSIDLKCQRVQEQIKEIGFGNITVYFNEEGKFLENMVQTYMNTAKTVLTRVEEKSGYGHNTLTLVFDYSPRTKSVDAYVTSPARSIKIHRFPFYNIPMPLLIEWARQDNSPKDYCGISTQRFRTFDGAQIEYQMQNDWHLVTHDCSSKYSFSVSSRASSNNSLEIEVNLRDQYLITMGEGPTVNLNGNKQPLSASHPLLRIVDWKSNLMAHVVYTPDNSIHISLPQDKLDLVYHSSSLIIKADPGLQGRLGGLCGSYSNSGAEKFLTPQGTTANSFKEFTNSYVIRNSRSSQDDADSRNAF